MNKDITKLMTRQSKINKNIYHLHVETDLENNYRWELYLNFTNTEKYFSDENRPIMWSKVDSIKELYDYLKKHGGLSDKWGF